MLYSAVYRNIKIRNRIKYTALIWIFYEWLILDELLSVFIKEYQLTKLILNLWQEKIALPLFLLFLQIELTGVHFF